MYRIISSRLPTGYVADSAEPLPEALAHPPDDLKEIRQIMYDAVQSERRKVGQRFQTLEESIDSTKSRVLSILRRKPILDKDGKDTGSVNYVADGFWNPVSGTGSLDDPGVYNYAYIPVSMSPQEATAYYASGGIPAVITDKKAKGALLNGYSFEGDGWEQDELKRLHDYAERVGFGAAVSDSLRDGLVYGGAVCYPRLKQDTSATLEYSVQQLLEEKIITADCIEHFVTTDRWNTVIVPNWNVTARDYLTPDYYYIPIGGVKVATKRSAVVRPKMLPYWGMLPQIGWGISDFEGYIPAYLAYRLVIMAIPIMAQQMSLLFHEIPLDGVIAMNGLESVRELLAHNDQVVRSWSIMHPASISSFGKVGAVERHYEGFDGLVKILQTDVCACAELPQTVLFPAEPHGLADSRGEDVTLKQAESVQKIAITVAPQFKRVTQILAYSCFGPDYFNNEAGKHKIQTLSLSFNPPSIQTPSEKAETGGKFAQFVANLTTAEFTPKVIMELAKQFFPDVEITDEMMDEIAGVGEGATAKDYADVLNEGGFADQVVKAGEDRQIANALGAGGLTQSLAAGGDVEINQALEGLPEALAAGNGNGKR